MAESSFDTVELAGMSIARIDTDQLFDHLFGHVARGQGGWLITANLDFLRRHAKDPVMRAVHDSASLRVADGMPLVWASKLRGQPLPGRVAGSSMVEPLCRRAAAEQRSIYFLGGDPAAAEAAEKKLLADIPGLS